MQWYSCGGQFAGITIATITTYMTWTVLLTKIKSYYHGKMNKADGKMGNIAMDSLINYEAVKVCFFIAVLLITCKLASEFDIC